MYRILCLALLAGGLLPAQTTPRAEGPLTALPYTPSLEPAFLDRSVDPCVDFFRFSCGNWIKRNPIPADQPRWDVYAKLGDDNLRFLWGMLEQSAKPTSGRTASEQKIGDYFAACMDEPAIEKAGARPLRPLLDEIAALKDAGDLPPVLARMHLQSFGSPLFGFGSNQDFADSSQVIAFATAGGLGLPDRDYYVKTDAKSHGDSRPVPRARSAHVRAAGRFRGRRQNRGADRDGYRNRAGQGFADPRRKARSLQAFPQDDARPVPGACRLLRLGGVLGRHGLGRAGRNQRHRARLLPGGGAPAQEPPAGRLEDCICAGTWRTPRRPIFRRRFVQADFDFYSKYLRGIDRDAAALEALRAAGGPRSGRGARPGLRGQDVRRRHQAARARHDQGDREGHGSRHPPAHLDGRRDQAAGPA